MPLLRAQPSTESAVCHKRRGMYIKLRRINGASSQKRGLFHRHRSSVCGGTVKGVGRFCRNGSLVSLEYGVGEGGPGLDFGSRDEGAVISP